MAERLVRLETEHANTAGWLKDIADRLKHVERQVWFGIGILTAVQIALRFWKP